MGGTFDLTYSRRRDGLGQRARDGAHVAAASRPIGAYDRCGDLRQVMRAGVAAHGSPEISDDRSPVLPSSLPPLFGEGVPRAAAVPIGVDPAQQRFGCQWVVASPCQPLHPRQCAQARRVRVPQRPPGCLVHDDRADQIRAADRQIQRDGRPGARPDRHGRSSFQCVQDCRGIQCMFRGRADSPTARPAVPAPVVGDHSAGSGQIAG